MNNPMQEKLEKAINGFRKRFVVKCSDGELLKDVEPSKVEAYLRTAILDSLEVELPKKKEIQIKCLQGQMKEGEKNIDCSNYPRGMKHEVLTHYQDGYIRGMSIGVEKTIDEITKALQEQGIKIK